MIQSFKKERATDGKRTLTSVSTSSTTRQPALQRQDSNLHGLAVISSEVTLLYGTSFYQLIF
jgi:hypothetical protein